MELNTISSSEQHQIDIATASHNQPSESLPFNLPSPALLNGTREDFSLVCVKLYKASTSGDLETAKFILNKHPELVQKSITESHETTLHMAVLANSCHIVQYLMSLMTEEDLELQNGNGETALCLAARTGNVEIANILVEKNERLIDITNSQGRMPLHVAALFGKHGMVKYLYHKSQKMVAVYWTHQCQSWVLEKCIEANLFDVALEMVTDLPKLAIDGSLLGVLARKPYAFHATRPNLIGRFVISLIYVGEYPHKENEAFRLLRIILSEIMKLPKAEIDDIIRGPPDEVKEGATQKYSSRMLFLAAEMGNTAFVMEVIRQYPHLAHEVNDDNQSIFHVAVSHRHEGIYKLLYEKDHIKDLIITLEDKNGNNMLHLVGESAKGKRLCNIPGMGLRSNLELLWFKEVESILPSHLLEKKNAAGRTPYEVFIKNHKDLFSDEEKMMKQIAIQLMVVAALVATISFAAVFTFPGGYDQDTGTPIFLHKTLSKIFIIFDSLSFISSTTSILMVLSIIMSNYDAYDLMVTLPKQLRICLASVFFSIATIIVTFLLNLFLLHQSNNSTWLPIIITASAAIPYLLFAIPQYALVGRFLPTFKMLR